MIDKEKQSTAVEMIDFPGSRLWFRDRVRNWPIHGPERRRAFSGVLAAFLMVG